MKIEDLQGKIEQYNKTLATIENNRIEWRDRTKPLLIDTLKKIAVAYPIGLHVQVLDFTKNHEGVNLTFGALPSGLHERTETSAKAYIKKGGTIVFSQAYDGDVYVTIMYPYIPEIIDERKDNTLGKYNIEEINSDFIVEKVATFFDEIIKWELSSPTNQLGFKIQQNKIQEQALLSS